MAPYVTQGSGQQNTEACVRARVWCFCTKISDGSNKKKRKVIKEFKELRGLRVQR